MKHSGVLTFMCMRLNAMPSVMQSTGIDFLRFSHIYLQGLYMQILSSVAPSASCLHSWTSRAMTASTSCSDGHHIMHDVCCLLPEVSHCPDSRNKRRLQSLLVFTDRHLQAWTIILSVRQVKLERMCNIQTNLLYACATYRTSPL